MTPLSKRDKTVLTMGTLAALFFLVIQFVYFPAVDKRQDLIQVLAREKGSVKKIEQLRKTYLALSQDLLQQETALTARPQNFTLFSFLDRQAEKSHVKKNIDYMKPFSRELDTTGYKLSKVKLKLKNIFLDDLVQFIRRVEAPGNGVFITALSLSETGKGKKMLDVIIEAQTLIQKEDA